jgi:hypothetical protein
MNFVEFRLVSLRNALLVAFASVLGSWGIEAQACPSLQPIANSGRDAAPALSDCLRRTPAGGEVRLAPGIYTLATPIVIARPVRIATAGLEPDSPGCGGLAPGRCATLRIDPAGRSNPARSMPIEIRADGVRLRHLIVEGVGQTRRQRDFCRTPDQRPLGGGIRVSASHFALRKSVLKNFACYTAVEITVGSRAPIIEGNIIGPNGDHRPGEIWADGVTIHDSEAAVVRDNVFIDNTDVQLIFGGCRNCRVEGNRFRHSLPFESGSFAALMLHSWPTTSGDFTGTMVRGNMIDCGPARRCGYGIMIGAAPWYPGRMTGGEISGNQIVNAMVGVNVDGLTGPVTVRSNSVRGSGGRFWSTCGWKDWPPVNIAPASRRFVSGDVSDAEIRSVSTERCLLNKVSP